MSEPTTTEENTVEEVQATQAEHIDKTLKDLAKDIKNFDSFAEQQEALEQELSQLGNELINVIENGVPEDSDRTEDVIAAERKRVDRKLTRLKEKASVDTHLAEVDAAMSALSEYRQELSS